MQADGIKRIEGLVYNDGGHMGELMNRFFNDFRELSLNPESSTIRSSIANSADITARGFRKLNDSLESMQADTDWQITATIDDINSNTRELAKLNESIFQFEAVKEPANELKDRRDQIVRQISEKLGVQVTEDDNGRMNIIAPGMGILVNGGESNELFVRRTGEDGDKAGGTVDIFLKDISGEHVVTHGIKDGEIAGMIYVRDKVLNPTLKKINTMAFEFSKAVNEVHRQGTGMDGGEGRNIFSELESVSGAARLLKIDKAIENNHELIASGFESGSPGDNRLALAMSELHTRPIIQDLGHATQAAVDGESAAGKLYTLNESFNSMVGSIATHIKMQDESVGHQESILNQLENYKKTVSGVSLEEEGIGIIQFQNAFNANAKIMKVSDELLQTILTIKT